MAGITNINNKVELRPPPPQQPRQHPRSDVSSGADWHGGWSIEYPRRGGARPVTREWRMRTSRAVASDMPQPHVGHLLFQCLGSHFVVTLRIPVYENDSTSAYKPATKPQLFCSTSALISCVLEEFYGHLPRGGSPTSHPQFRFHSSPCPTLCRCPQPGFKPSSFAGQARPSRPSPPIPMRTPRRFCRLPIGPWSGIPSISATEWELRVSQPRQ